MVRPGRTRNRGRILFAGVFAVVVLCVFAPSLWLWHTRNAKQKMATVPHTPPSTAKKNLGSSLEAPGGKAKGAFFRARACSAMPETDVKQIRQERDNERGCGRRSSPRLSSDISDVQC
eukprot:1817788-Rhodomonas_salina.1